MPKNDTNAPDAQHPFQTCPPLPKAEFERLKESIALQGVVVPLVVDDDGTIIDGHHRLRAWEELRDEGHDVAEPERRAVSGRTVQQKLTLSRALNITHRSLTNSQKIELVDAELTGRLDHADRWIAQDLGVSHTLVSKRREALELAGTIERVTGTTGLDGKFRPRKPLPVDDPTGSDGQLDAEAPQPTEADDDSAGGHGANEIEPDAPAATPLLDADKSTELPNGRPGFCAGTPQDMLSVLRAHRQKAAPAELFTALLKHFEATVTSLDEQASGHTLVLTLTPNNATAALAA